MITRACVLCMPPVLSKRQVWDHRGNTVMSWNEDLDEVTASRSKGASEYRRDAPQATESQSLGLGSRELPSVASGGQSSQGSVRLPKIDPKLSRAHTAPSGESLPLKDSIQSALESSSVKALRERLRSEMTLHEQTRAHAQEGTKIPSVLQELERRLQLATSRKRDLRASSEDKPRFGISSGAPYTAKAARTEKEKRTRDMLKEERMSALSRQEQSRTRVQAFGKLGHAGLSTWDVRLDEKVMQGLHLELPAFFENDPDQEWAKFIHNESRGVATSLNCVLPTDVVDRDKTYVHRCFQKALLHCDDIEVCWKGPSTTYQRSKSHRGHAGIFRVDVELLLRLELAVPDTRMRLHPKFCGFHLLWQNVKQVSQTQDGVTPERE
eukprot:s1282_g7.t1